MTTLHTVQAAIINYADQADASDLAVSEAVSKAVAALVSYVPEGAADPRQTAEFKAVGDSVKVALRSIYVKRQRFTGRDRSGEVNMKLAKSLLDMPDAEREALPKDSEAKKIWAAMLTYCRNIWRDVADAAYPKTDETGESGKASKAKAKKAMSSDDLLAALDTILAGNPAPGLVDTLEGQIRRRFADYRKATK
jgi:hypothetical protein